MRKNTANNIRKRARKRLAELLIKQNNLCYDCDRKIYRVKEYTKKGWVLVNFKRDVAILRKENLKTEFLFATIEHIKPIIKGGKNTDDNLVAVCVKCNLIRNAQRKNQIELLKKLKTWGWPKV